MLLCNSLGVAIIIMIAIYHFIGTFIRYFKKDSKFINLKHKGVKDEENEYKTKDI